MQTLWPSVQVGDDSVFQCVRELRASLGDEKRQIIKSVVGIGYLFDVPVSSEPAAARVPETASPEQVAATPGRAQRVLRSRGPATFAAIAALGAIFSLTIVAPFWARDAVPRKPWAIAVMPIVGANQEVAPTATAVTDLLTDGLASISNLRVVTPEPLTVAARNASPSSTSLPVQRADFVLSGELQKTDRSWELQARLIRSATREVIWTAPVSVDIAGTESDLQRARLAAALGYRLARRDSAATIDRCIADGGLRVVRFGRSVRISENALAEFIAEASKCAAARNPNTCRPSWSLSTRVVRALPS